MKYYSLLCLSKKNLLCLVKHQKKSLFLLCLAKDKKKSLLCILCFAKTKKRIISLYFAYFALLIVNSLQLFWNLRLIRKRSCFQNYSRNLSNLIPIYLLNEWKKTDFMKGNLAKHVSKIGIVLPFSRVIKQEHFLLDINSFFSPAFSLFNVVTFNNDACTSSSITTQSGARIGQCFTAEGKSVYINFT